MPQPGNFLLRPAWFASASIQRNQNQVRDVAHDPHSVARQARASFRDAPILRQNSQQQPVPVTKTQAMQMPENFSLSSAIGFDKANRVFDGGAPKLPYLSERFGFVLRGVHSDGEGRELRIEPSATFEQQVGHVIKCGPDVLYSIACDYGEIWRRMTESPKDVLDPPVLRIMLGPDFMWAGLDKSLGFTAEINDVLLGPFNFTPD
jgi:hypothetical protein